MAEACRLRLILAYSWLIGGYILRIGARFVYSMASFSIENFFSPVATILDEIIFMNLDLDFEVGYDAFCKILTLRRDEEIVDHYANFAPDFAIPILRKGTSFKMFKRLYDIEDTLGNLNMVFCDKVFIHISGVFFCEYDNPVNRYCFDCMYNNISKDPSDIKVFHQHKMEYSAALASDLICNKNNLVKYWCTICDCFLFNVLCSDINMCNECDVFIKYDSNTGLPLQFFNDDIDFFFSVDSKLFFDD